MSEATMTLEEYLAAVNRDDAADCEACGLPDVPCLYHEGVEAGVEWARDKMNEALSDE